jgi:hypothetical protein
MVGQTVGRLHVDEPAGVHPTRRVAMWRCTCTCGQVRIYRGDDLRAGKRTSCGCGLRDRLARGNPIHRLANHPASGIWYGMIDRCYNPDNPAYKNYGARGITVCDRWRTLERFIDDLTEGRQPGPRPSTGFSLDRDLNGPYSPDNTRWATDSQQMRNRRNNRLLTFNGITLTTVEWADRTGIRDKTIQERIDKHKWSIERALTEPVGYSHGSNKYRKFTRFLSREKLGIL